MGDYKVGDWLIDKHSKQVFVIHKFYGYSPTYELWDVNNLNTKVYITTLRIYNEFSRLDLSCPVAQVLYTSNSNKGGDK